MDLNDFNYNLPESNIAQYPVTPRDACRLMVVNRSNQSIVHTSFMNLGELLNAGDLLVVNNSRVIPSRIKGNTLENSNNISILLLKCLSGGLWQVLIKPGRKFKIGSNFSLFKQGVRLNITVIDILDDGSDLDKTELIAGLGKKDTMYVSVIQQLLTKIETIETKVTALENA